MSEAIWERLRGDKLTSNLHLQELLFSDGEKALFRADYVDSAGNAREVLVRTFLERGRDSKETINRLLEAKYLEHPHLVRYFTADTLLTDEGRAAYAVTERFDLWGSRSLVVEEALDLAQHILSGLEYLHERDLIYCILSPDTVASVGSEWKLSDFSQLRLAGNDTSDEALSLAARLDTCPPEAASGVFSPAWDIWAFGQTLRKALAGCRAHSLDPFKGVILACLNINPSSRPSLGQLSGLLQAGQSKGREYGLPATAGS
jgi:serine/threonine protein kinase